MEEMDNVEDQYNYLVKFLAMTDPNQENLQSYQSVWDELETEEEQKLFIDEIIKDGIPLKQEPFFRNINSFDLYDIYEEMEVELSPNNITMDNIAIGEMYYLRLKHEPTEKYSARAIDNLSMSGLPTKTRDNKNHTSRINNNPIRIGKQLAA